MFLVVARCGVGYAPAISGAVLTSSSNRSRLFAEAHTYYLDEVAGALVYGLRVGVLFLSACATVSSVGPVHGTQFHDS